MVIDHKSPGERQIFVTCNVSNHGVGAMLLFGERWADVGPVTFNNTQLTVCEKNYPVHEKELLVIVKVLKR